MKISCRKNKKFQQKFTTVPRRLSVGHDCFLLVPRTIEAHGQFPDNPIKYIYFNLLMIIIDQSAMQLQI
jgi:hypothetical protein